MTEEEVRRDLSIGFEYSYLHEEWVNPLADALDELAHKDALWKSRTEAKCIWEIVLHLAVWNENIVERINTGKPARPAAPTRAGIHDRAASEFGLAKVIF